MPRNTSGQPPEDWQIQAAEWLYDTALEPIQQISVQSSVSVQSTPTRPEMMRWCDGCHLSHPASSFQRVATIDRYGTPDVSRYCPDCVSRMVSCEYPGCNNRARRQGHLHSAILHGRSISVCAPCSRTRVACAECRDMVFRSEREHDCHPNRRGSTVPRGDWSECRVCRYHTQYADDGHCLRCQANRVSCDQCGRQQHRDLTYLAVSGDGSSTGDLVLCATCRNHGSDNNTLHNCGHCGNLINGPVGSCTCYTRRTCRCYTCRDSGRLIKSYSYKPNPLFRGTGPLFLGFELEVEVGDSDDSDGCGNCGDCDEGYYDDCQFREEAAEISEVAHVAQDGFGDVVYLKTDASIRNGFEIVSHPMAYDWAIENLRWGTLNRLSGAGAAALDNCGLHVHASRAGFDGPAHQYRWLQFIHRNEPGITAVARRRGSGYAEFQTTPQARKYQRMKNVVLKGRNGEPTAGQRYQAVNCQNHNTFEVRVFASTLDERELQGALGLVDASIRYTGQIRARDVIGDKALSFERFADWVGKRPEYAPLASEIERLTVQYQAAQGTILVPR